MSPQSRPVASIVLIIVANISFRPRLTGSGPEGTVDHNPTKGVT
jgi:hypothetical protein